ncbi:MAG TPA: asparaginase [Thermotogota bacterium]|jgi:L-asparaginase|nr:asparaginase [Thermotogota bacterium]NLH19712.1 asparaginase [Thermotogaceae bacterium]OQC31243.1 MAG: L-asparaginase [Thermotogota bacterium ADurb.Bin062]HNW46305.1 asparaginase [Thermotogota bacterium]HNY81484.1 asparaginase [Thermotogota bacterium]
MKNIVIVTTGGTIAMKKLPAGVDITPEGNQEIMELEGLTNLAQVKMVEFANLPSPHMSPQLMWQLSRRIQGLVDRDEVDGIVVTHGTDTLEETAYFLDITVLTKKPIVLTAAMRNINELGTDGPRNIFSSIRVACSTQAIGAGAVVCLNDEIHAAREVNKTYTSNVATFESPGFGPLGIVDEDGVFFFRKSTVRYHIPTTKIEPHVALLKTYTGDLGEFIDYAVDKGYKGIVLEGFGRGNVPDTIINSLKTAIQHQVAVVLVSRAYKGRVLDIYSYEGGGAYLKKMGVILAHEQTGQKARIKLMVVLGKTSHIEEIRGYFEMANYFKMSESDS